MLGVLGSPSADEAFEEALLHHDLVDRAPIGYLTTTPDGLITAVNQTFLSWTGHRADALVERCHFSDLLSPGGRIYYDTHYAPLLAMQGTVREIALEVVRADRTRLPVLVNAVMERDDRGAPVVVRTAVFDATERRSYERELLRAKEAAEAAEHRAVHLARTLQQTLIPPTPPSIPGLDVAAAYRPSGNGDEVGGDFYDVFQIADDDWAVVIGDVAGKGVEAAVVTALARYTLRAAVVGTQRPSDALRLLNSALLKDGVERFCTVALARLRRADPWTAEIAIGGHPPPLLKWAGRRCRPVGAPGSLLGVFDDPVFTDTTVELQPGACLLLYTDGVTEGRRRAEFFGDDRLAEVLDRLGDRPASEVVAGLVGELLAFQAQDPRDDIATVAVRTP